MRPEKVSSTPAELIDRWRCKCRSTRLCWELKGSHLKINIIPETYLCLKATIEMARNECIWCDAAFLLSLYTCDYKSNGRRQELWSPSTVACFTQMDWKRKRTQASFMNDNIGSFSGKGVLTQRVRSAQWTRWANPADILPPITEIAIEISKWTVV